ncbi:LysE family translocator, partial [Loktanella salsilacus]
MTLAAFASIVLIHLAAAISPGPSFVVALRVAAAEGFRVAAALALGFGLGAVLWAGAAMAGLALVFSVLPALFLALKFVGAAFLIYLAVQMWRHAATPMP